jgi:hypothetical protein
MDRNNPIGSLDLLVVLTEDGHGHIILIGHYCRPLAYGGRERPRSRLFLAQGEDGGG